MIDKYIKGEKMQRQYTVTKTITHVEAVELTDEEIETMTEAEIPVVPIDERKGFEEVELAFTEEAAVKEAKRCYRCDLEQSSNE